MTAPSDVRDVRLEVLALVNKLHAEIMNLPHRHGFGVEYAAGHRDARHAAAEALARSDAALALAALAAAGLALREAIGRNEFAARRTKLASRALDAYDAALAAALGKGGDDGR